MRAALVSPAKYLEQIQPFSNYHLILTHLVIYNPAYRDFYRARSEAGDYIILDNSVIEKSGRTVPMKDIVLAAVLTHPSVIVLPDFLFDGERTYDELINAIKSPQLRFLREHRPEIKLAAVAQGLDKEEWIDSFHILNETEGIDLIGIPKVSGQTFGARWKALEIIEPYVKKPCHLLGFWHLSSLEDLQHETTFAFAQGIDTPKPIRLAAAGKTLDDWAMFENMHDRSFLDRLNGGTVDPGLLKENCQRFVELCKGKADGS